MPKPARDVTCPHCAETNPARAFHHVDVDGNRYDHNGAPLSVPTETMSNPRSLSRLFAGRPPRRKRQTQSERLDLLARDLDIECPHCGEHLSSAFLKRKSIFVAVVGESSSAKTSFLSASIVKWRDGDDIVDAGVSYSPEEQSETFTQAVERMFIDHVAPGTTMPGGRREPLIIVARSKADAVNIVLIDVSGEDLVSASRMAETTRFIAIASHIFVLVTPMIALGDRHRPIARAILSNQRVATNIADATGDNSQSTDTLLQIISGIHELQNGDGRQIAAPHRGVFVVLTKADMLAGLLDSEEFAPYIDGVIPPHDWLHGEGAGSDDIDVDTIDDTSARTRALIRAMHPNIGSNLHTSFPTAKYFAVSASGCPAKRDVDGEFRFENVVPYRCGDPFLSMLRAIPELNLAFSRQD
ncbi:hypothetical protein HG717_00235 [Rhodococcus erythropolis]|uniref:hypothetical protein n=1 Tax=Rhodococcus erythropolis TaxID=1833 RepID=UPI001C9AA5F5|nr:hypothetical protein [Rhodococcus erythropolis]MBY6382366.1 hypothetical protein [Rhodococcus erythropolis]